jgi:type I restriction enzyme S subunit
MKEGWSYKKLGELCSSELGKTLNSSKDKGELRPYLCAINIQWDKIDTTTLKTTRFEDNELERYSVKQGDLLVCEGGDVGRSAIWEDSEPIQYQNALHRVRFNGELLNRFCLYYLFYLKHTGIIDARFAKGVTIKHLVKSSLLSIPIPFPHLSVQQTIVYELDKINELIALKTSQLKDLDTLAQSLFYEMFGDLNHTTFSVKSLNEVCEFIKDGTHQTPTYTEDAINGVKFLSAKDVVSGYINWTNIKYIPLDLHNELYQRVAPKRGDILLCKNGTTGICAIVDTDDIFDIYVSLALLRPKANCLPVYLHYAINNPYTKRQFDDSLKGIGVPNLHLGEIKKTKIILSPLALQQSFVNKIKAIEEQKSRIRQSLTDLETLLQNRMDYWFND